MKASFVCLAFVTVAIFPVSGFAGSGQVTSVSAPADGVYIVRLSPTAVADGPAHDVAATLVARAGGAATHTFETVFRGFRFVGTAAAAQAISQDPRVASVQQASRIIAHGVQSPAPSWGLDRIDQAIYPLDNAYTYTYTGVNTVIYVVDGGVSDYSDVRGRILPYPRSRNFVPDPVTHAVNGATLAPDCFGTDHGSAIASIAGGYTYGIAKDAQVVNIRVLDCSSSADTATIVAGIDYMIADHQSHAGQMSVANISLGTFIGNDDNLDDAVIRATQAGIVVVVSAGNSGQDACTHSPSRAGNATYLPASINNPTGASVITVGGTMQQDWYWSSTENGVFEASNYGPCVDIFAPSYHVTTVDRFGYPYSNWWGTSFAAPHVAGVAAQRLQYLGGSSPGVIEALIKDNGTPGVIYQIPTNAITPNLLLYEYLIKRRICCG